MGKPAAGPSGLPEAVAEFLNGKSLKDFHEARSARVPYDDTETRECENCGQQKPIEEMSTVFLPGTGESYQCEECRGGNG